MVTPIRPLLLSASDVAQLAPSLPEIIDLVEQTYRMEARGEVEIPPKVALHPHDAQSFLQAMPAWVSGAPALGMKWVSFFPGNAARDLPASPSRANPRSFPETMRGMRPRRASYSTAMATIRSCV